MPGIADALMARERLCSMPGRAGVPGLLSDRATETFTDPYGVLVRLFLLLACVLSAGSAGSERGAVLTFSPFTPLGNAPQVDSLRPCCTGMRLI